MLLSLSTALSTDASHPVRACADHEFNEHTFNDMSDGIAIRRRAYRGLSLLGVCSPTPTLPRKKSREQRDHDTLRPDLRSSIPWNRGQPISQRFTEGKTRLEKHSGWTCFGMGCLSRHPGRDRCVSSQKVFKIGEEQCFDEMCFAVVGVQAMPNQGFHASAAAPSMLYVVKIRVASHSRGRAQAEGGLRWRLYDNDKYINVSEPAQKAYDSQYGGSPKLTQKIGPGESIVCNLVFDMAQGLMQHPVLTLDHGFTPGFFVIG